MRTSAVLLGIAVLLLGSFAACAEEQSVQDEPDEPSTVTVTVGAEDETTTVEEEEETTTEEEQETTTEEVENDDSLARVGDTITLAGNDEGLSIAMTLLKFVDLARSGNEFFQPRRGRRYAAVRLRLENVGSTVYDDSPSNGAVVIDTQGQQYPADIFDAVEPGLGSPAIKPGSMRVGFITFEVPKRAKLDTLQFTLESGFGPETGEWVLRR